MQKQKNKSFFDNKKTNKPQAPVTKPIDAAPPAVAPVVEEKPKVETPPAIAPAVTTTEAVSESKPSEEKRDHIGSFRTVLNTYCTKMAAGKPVGMNDVIVEGHAFYNALYTALLHEDVNVAIDSYRLLMDSMHANESGALGHDHIFRGFDNVKMWGSAKARREMETILSIAMDCRDPKSRAAMARTKEWSAVPDLLQAKNRDVIWARLKACFGID